MASLTVCKISRKPYSVKLSSAKAFLASAKTRRAESVVGFDTPVNDLKRFSKV